MFLQNKQLKSDSAAGVPAAPILNLKEISEDKHIAEEREMFVYD